MHEVVIGLVQANREIKATAETVRETDTDVSLSFIEIEAEDRLLLGAADLRVSPPPRRAVAHLTAEHMIRPVFRLGGDAWLVRYGSR